MTVTEALHQFILADATLAAKVSKVYPQKIQQGAVSPCAQVRAVSALSFSNMQGAIGQTRMRLEITFWSASNLEAEQLALRMLSISRTFNGVMGGAGGVTVAVSQVLGPRSIYHEESRFYGAQVDILAIVNLDTAS